MFVSLSQFALDLDQSWNLDVIWIAQKLDWGVRPASADTETRKNKLDPVGFLFTLVNLLDFSGFMLSLECVGVSG